MCSGCPQLSLTSQCDNICPMARWRFGVPTELDWGVPMVQEVLLVLQTVFLFGIWLRIEQIATRTKERFPTSAEEDFEWSQKDSHGHWEAHKNDKKNSLAPAEKPEKPGQTEISKISLRTETRPRRWRGPPGLPSRESSRLFRARRHPHFFEETSAWLPRLQARQLAPPQDRRSNHPTSVPLAHQSK